MLCTSYVYCARIAYLSSFTESTEKLHKLFCDSYINGEGKPICNLSSIIITQRLWQPTMTLFVRKVLSSIRMRRLLLKLPMNCRRSSFGMVKISHRIHIGHVNQFISDSLFAQKHFINLHRSKSANQKLSAQRQR